MVEIKMAKRKRRYQKRKKTTSKMDMAVIILIVVSILLAVLIYTKSGMIGTKLNEILGRSIWNSSIYITYWYFCNSNKNSIKWKRRIQNEINTIWCINNCTISST